LNVDRLNTAELFQRTKSLCRSIDLCSSRCKIYQLVKSDASMGGMDKKKKLIGEVRVNG